MFQWGSESCLNTHNFLDLTQVRKLINLSHKCDVTFHFITFSNMTSRDFCFTSYKLDSLIHFQSLSDKEKEKVRSLIAQHEICPDTQREHIQGFVIFNTPQRVSALQRLLNDKCHVEARKGSKQQAADYCRKEESRKEGTEPFIYGDVAAFEETQGKR